MSVNKRVVRDTYYARLTMSEIAVRLTYERLDALTKLHHRGRHDTWAAARDRAAKAAGIEPSYAKRIWDRWQSMKDVSGGVFMAIHEAYEAQCKHNTEMAALHRLRAEEKRNGGPTNPDGMGSVCGVARSAEGKAPPSSP